MPVRGERSTLAKQIASIPADVRPTVQATRRMVKRIAPRAEEVPYRSTAPRSKSAMWKLVRWSVGGEYVAGLGVFSTYAALFFYRGRELDDGTGLLHGSGRDSRFVRLREPADPERPAVRRLVRKAFAASGRSTGPASARARTRSRRGARRGAPRAAG